MLNEYKKLASTYAQPFGPALDWLKMSLVTNDVHCVLLGDASQAGNRFLTCDHGEVQP